MSTHKFAVGDRVELSIDRYGGDVPRGLYTISRQLPVEANICHYRVRHVADGHERAVKESDIVGSGVKKSA